MNTTLLFLLALAPQSSPDALPQTPTEVFQHPVKLSQSDALLAITARLNQVRVLRAQFKQTKKIKVLRRPMRSTGQFLFSPDYGVCWRTGSPFPTMFVITQKGIRQTSPDSEPVVIEADERPFISGFTRVFTAMFSGDHEALDKGFDLYFSGDAHNWTIGLIPKSKVAGRLIDRIVLKGTEHMDQIFFQETSGDLTHIVFSDVALQPETLTPEEQQRFDF